VVEEYDPQQDLYIVRRRHAHAWAIAYINGFWQIVDSTPSQWLTMENEQASLFQPINDWFSKQLFMFKQWRLQQDEQENPIWLSAAALLALYILWRVYSARRQLTHKNKAIDSTGKLNSAVYQGMDSEFYFITQQFQGTEYEKSHAESIQEWIKRLQIPQLNEMYKLHYQLRFDPCGLSLAHRKQLQQQVNNWLKTSSL
jgi:hypothetical protein